MRGRARGRRAAQRAYARSRVCDRFELLGREPNAQVALDLDVPGFWGLVLAAVERLGAGA